uniref:Phytochrome kinase substrate 1 n=1 Tax=Kalanchoe fedtschenkoi TaxID=63787 RepID=A0A7N0TRB9_KALFE
MLTQSLSLERGNCGTGPERDPSFSSYLTGAEERAVLSPPKQSFGGAADDGEIDVFSAEKYFSGGLEEEKPKTHSPRASSLRSASSLNSQSALLQRAVMSPALNGGAKVKGRGCFGSFRCRCVCSDKNSIAVEEYETFGDNLTQSAAKETVKKGFSSVNAETKRETTYLTLKDVSVDYLPLKPRRSLEVFGPPLLPRPNKPFSFESERKQVKTGLPVIPTAVADEAYADSDSDASSDLFEIEHFTGKMNPFLSRNVSGSATPTSAYAPSEASIEWSVATASAADFPITSDYKELKSGKIAANRKTGSTVTNQKVTAAAAADSRPRRIASSFLTCNSQDAVKTVGHAHTTYEKMPDPKLRKSQDSPAQALRPQTDAKLTGLETSGSMRLGISSRMLEQSNSLRASNMLYLH